MDALVPILFWAGILLMVDGALGLLFLEKWQRLAAGLNILQIAWIELTLAGVLLAAHYVLLSGL